MSYSDFNKFHELYRYFNSYLILNHSVELINLANIINDKMELELKFIHKSDSEIIDMNL